MWLARSKERRFGGGSDFELGHLRFSRICKFATGGKNPDRKKGAHRVVEARGWRFAGAPAEDICEGELWNGKLLVDNVRSSRGLREQMTS